MRENLKKPKLEKASQTCECNHHDNYHWGNMKFEDSWGKNWTGFCTGFKCGCTKFSESFTSCVESARKQNVKKSK